MKKLIILLLLCLIVSLSISAGDLVKAKVIRVIDGDSIIVTVEGQEKRIRLAAIDAPELKQPGGEESKKWLQKQIDHKDIFIKIVDRDHYNRDIAFIYDFEASRFLLVTSINNLSIAHAMAWIYIPIDDYWLELESKNKSRRKGIFALSQSPPWEFRETKRDEKTYMKWSEIPEDASFAIRWNYSWNKTHENSVTELKDNIKKNTDKDTLLIVAYTLSKSNNEMFVFLRDEIIKIRNRNDFSAEMIMYQRNKIHELEKRVKILEEKLNISKESTHEN